MNRGGLLQRTTLQRVALALSLAVLLWLLLTQAHFGRAQRWGSLGTYDFVAYWSAARLLREGQNPYDAGALLQLEESLGWPMSYAQRIWNPPWTLALMVPFSLLPFGLSRLVWLVFQLMLILGCSIAMWRYLVPQDTRYWIALLLAFGFFPAQSSLVMGQMGACLLAGAVGFLYAAHRRRDLVAGGALFLLMIKPQVGYLFWPAVLWWACRERRWRVLVGWGAALIAASGLACLLSPQVFALFAESAMDTPVDLRTPTMSTLVRQLFGWERRWLSFLPSLLGILGLVVWLCRRRRAWNWEGVASPLLLASVITTPYGWSHDQLVLLPVFVAVVGRVLPLRSMARAAVVAVGAACQIGCAVVFRSLTSYDQAEFRYLAWNVPVLAGLYVWSGWLNAADAGTEDAMVDVETNGTSS